MEILLVIKFFPLVRFKLRHIRVLLLTIDYQDAVGQTEQG